MPLILVAALVGYVVALERLLIWLHWSLADRALRRAGTARALQTALKQARAGRRATPLAFLLGRALTHRGDPPERREQAMHLEILARLPEVEARIATIGWLGGILPMLGLLGTVSGMIATFRELSLTASRQVLSQGLSEALWTTEVGLLGALPLLAAHHLLTRLRSRWLNGLELRLALLFQAAPEGAEPGDAAQQAEPQAETQAGRAAPPTEAHEA